MRHYLHCVDSKAGEVVPRPFGELVHGAGPGDIPHFDCYMSVTVDGGLNDGEEFKYILIMLDDLCNFLWLELSQACTAATTLRHLLPWCKLLGVPEVWVSDT